MKNKILVIPIYIQVEARNVFTMPSERTPQQLVALINVRGSTFTLALAGNIVRDGCYKVILDGGENQTGHKLPGTDGWAVWTGDRCGK